MQTIDYYFGPRFSLFGTETKFADADVVAYGVPLDSTTTFKKGSSRGPHAVREASLEIETFISDRCIDVLDKVNLCDMGNIWIPKGNLENALDNIAVVNELIFKSNKVPLAIGGEHLITLGCLKPVRNALLIVFDAHADLRKTYSGDKLSHATWLYHALDQIGPQNIFLVGVRSLSKEEYALVKEKELHVFFMHDIKTQFEYVEKTLSKNTKKKDVYVSFDMDVYDAPYVPATGTPEPGGLNFFEATSLLRSIHGKILGFDVTETARDLQMITPTTAAKTILEMLALL